MEGEFASWVDLVRFRVERKAEERAYTFLYNGESEALHLTYAQLDTRARAIAARLRELVMAGGRVLLIYAPDLEFVAAFLGCLYAGVVAVPVYPPRPTQGLGRLRAIVEDCQARAILTHTALEPRLRSLAAAEPWAATLEWLVSDQVPGEHADLWQPPELGPQDLAFLQYTSGSTSTPKGVMISHGNLLSNGERLRVSCSLEEGATFVSWLPFYHDMGLIGMVLETLYVGAHTVLMAPVSFIQRPLRWLRAISRYQAIYSGGPNFAYDLCVRRLRSEELHELDLSSWRTAFNGAEPVRAETLERFAETFAPCGFRREALFPCYGMAETTLVVSGGAPTQPTVEHFDAAALGEHRVEPAAGGRAVVGCGRVVAEHELVIVEPESGGACPPATVGEIWVSGPSVGQGYWGREEATESAFRATLPEHPGREFLRTGDLGFLHGDEVFITGRLKDLIIVRGRNHHPQDVELTAEHAHSALRPGCGAVFMTGEGERLALVYEAERGFRGDVEEVAGAVRRAVAEEHELQVHEVVLIRGRVPKTTSGKIQRSACRRQLAAGELTVVGRSVLAEGPAVWESGEELDRGFLLDLDPSQRRQALAEHLRVVAARVLRLDAKKVELEPPLLDLGLDSLAAVELQHELQAGLGVAPELSLLLEGASLDDLAGHLLPELEAPPTEAEAALVPLAEPLAELPLSYMQRAFWFHHEMQPDSAAYNVAFAAHLGPDVELAALQRAFAHLVERHRILSAHVTLRDGEPRLHLGEPRQIELVEIDTEDDSEAELYERLVEEAHRPFDLTAAPLLRAAVYRRSPQQRTLLLVVHHLVIDGWSFWILLDELAGLYQAELSGMPAPLAPLAVGYGDFVRWQQEMLDGPEGERLRRFWEDELPDEAPALNLPLDRVRPSVETDAGADVTLRLDARLTESLRALAREEATTLYVVLLAAFQILLGRYTGDTEVVVGSPVSGRSRPELDAMTGCLFNLLALTGKLSGNPPLRVFLRELRQKVMAGVDHQDYPSHLIAERLASERRARGAAFFPAMLLFQKPQRGVHVSCRDGEPPGLDISLGALELRMLHLEQRSARSDIELELVEARDGVLGWIRYRQDLFETATIERMAHHFERLLAEIARNPERRVADFDFLDAAEVELLVERWGRSDFQSGDGGESVVGETVDRWFERQVRRTPEKVVSVYEGTALTFRELDAEANRLADFLVHLRDG